MSNSVGCNCVWLMICPERMRKQQHAIDICRLLQWSCGCAMEGELENVMPDARRCMPYCALLNAAVAYQNINIATICG
jgi:hypothetical protein